MTRATARRRVRKALAAVGCRGRRNDHDIWHGTLEDSRKREELCRIVAGEQWSQLHDELFSLTHHSRAVLFCGDAAYDEWYRGVRCIMTISDLVEAVRAAYPR